MLICIYTRWLQHCPVTESLTQQTSYHVQSKSHWHRKACTTSSNWVIDTANLVPRPVTEPSSQQNSYHVQSLSHWHSKPRTTSSHRVFDTANFLPRPVTESLTQQSSYHVQSLSFGCCWFNFWHDALCINDQIMTATSVMMMYVYTTHTGLFLYETINTLTRAITSP